MQSQISNSTPCLVDIHLGILCLSASLLFLKENGSEVTDFSKILCHKWDSSPCKLVCRVSRHSWAQILVVAVTFLHIKLTSFLMIFSLSDRLNFADPASWPVSSLPQVVMIYRTIDLYTPTRVTHCFSSIFRRRKRFVKISLLLPTQLQAMATVLQIYSVWSLCCQGELLLLLLLLLLLSLLLLLLLLSSSLLLLLIIMLLLLLLLLLEIEVKKGGVCEIVVRHYSIAKRTYQESHRHGLQHGHACEWNWK